MRFIRSWLADRLGLENEAARNGDWWEIDFVLVLIAGAFAAGLIAWFSA